jgi:predicted alpha/beta-fold hydrolase
LSDGGEVAIDHGPSDESAPLVIIIPGLLSTIDDQYIKTQIQEAIENGYNWCLINYRGCSHKLSDGKPFDSNDLLAFKEPVVELLKRNQGKKVYIVGYSLGGNVVVNLLADPEINTLNITAAATI